MKIRKLKSGKVEIILENKKELLGMVIRHYASVDNIVDGIKRVCEDVFKDTDHKEIQDLYDIYESFEGEENRIEFYVKFLDISEKK